MSHIIPAGRTRMFPSVRGFYLDETCEGLDPEAGVSGPYYGTCGHKHLSASAAFSCRLRSKDRDCLYSLTCPAPEGASEAAARAAVREAGQAEMHERTVVRIADLLLYAETRRKLRLSIVGEESDLAFYREGEPHAYAQARRLLLDKGDLSGGR